MAKESEPGTHRPNLNLHFVRHGEPLVYGDTNSKLSPTGKEQMRAFAHNFTEEIKNVNSEVRIIYSGRTRTFESATIIGNCVRDSLPKNSTFQGLFRLTALGPADTLDRIVDRGIPIDQAFRYWKRDHESFKDFNISGPKKVRTNMVQLIKTLNDAHEINLFDKPEAHYILATHETTLAALVSDMGSFDIQELSIECAECLKVVLDQEYVSYFFRDQKFALNKTDFFNI